LPGRFEIQLSFRLIEQWPVDVLDRGRFQFEQVDRRLHRFGDGREEDESEPFLARQRDDLQFRGENRSEGAFAAA